VLSDTISAPIEGLDSVRPFGVETTTITGHAVRLERVLNSIISRHNYPDVVNFALAKLITLSVVLHGTFKYKGVLTLQIKGAGPIQTMVCDVDHCGHVRAYARFDEADLPNWEPEKEYSPSELFKEGYLLMVLDPEDLHQQRYQGVVELSGETLESSFMHYFTQSVQCQTMIQLYVMPPEKAKHEILWRDSQHLERFGWRSGCVMIQQLQDSKLSLIDDWDTAIAMVMSVTQAELIGENLPLDALLYRLFHECGVRVHAPLPLEARCRCSQEKVEKVLSELADQFDEPSVEVTCEFCGLEYRVDMSAGGKNVS
jgi:molecular chaperone Hsp33